MNNKILSVADGMANIVLNGFRFVEVHNQIPAKINENNKKNGDMS